MPKKYFIKTYGCQMNINDSEQLAGVLVANGYKETSKPESADIILVNVCVVRQNAEDKAAWYITSLKGIKKDKPNLVIGVCGCIVTEPGQDAKKRFPHADLFIGPRESEKLSAFLGGSCDYKPKRKPSGTSWVTIMQGCNNFCSYCVVPYVRGHEKSRKMEEIIAEIKEIDQNTHPELYLLGQNVNSYKYGLANLLKEVESLKKFKRIRFMTSHPKDMTDEIIKAVADLPSVCEFFHLPIQYGHDDILKKMNRKYTVDQYIQIVDRIRNKIPNAAITGDIIVGFPTETQEQFMHTLYIMRKIEFDAVNTAAYSTRPGTAASKLVDDVPPEVKAERLQEIMKVVNDMALRRNRRLIGKHQEILVDGNKNNHWTGRTRTNKIVKFASERNNLLGELVSVKIISAQSWLLEGELING